MTAAAMTDDRVLTIERHFKATPERVFDAWTRPDLLVKWWGPEGYDIPEHDLDVRAGGSWRTVMRSPEGNLMTVSGVYRTLDRPGRLEFTWAWDQDDGSRGHETLVTLTFEPAEGGTLMHLIQRTFQDTEARDRHVWGWNSTFNCLESLLADSSGN